MQEEEEEFEEVEVIADSQTLAEIDLFFKMAIDLENNKFNLYPREAEEMQRKCIDLIMKRLELFEYE